MAEKTFFPTLDNHTCVHCRFYDIVTNIEQRTQVTICRHQAPRAFAQFGIVPGPDGQPVGQWQQCSVWPLVQPSDWCGDFARAPSKSN